jgi:hypothetical protein
VINARWLLDRDGRLVVTVAKTVEAFTNKLDAALGSVAGDHPQDSPRHPSGRHHG